MNSASRPKIFGIVNITRDSFSDGGQFLDQDRSIAHAKALLAAGADVLDIGAAASNPGAEHVPSDIEIARLRPILEAGLPLEKISIDSFSTETQAWALGQGVGWINDIQGFPDRSLYPALAASQAQLVVMHNVVRRGIAQIRDTKPGEIMSLLFDFFDQRVAALEAAGVRRSRLVLDPGMGHFLGKDPEVSLTVLRNLGTLSSRYGLPLLVSVSRKSFIRNLASVDVAGSGAATLAAELFAASRGAGCLRTHDVRALRQALDVWFPLAGNSGISSVR